MVVSDEFKLERIVRGQVWTLLDYSKMLLSIGIEDIGRGFGVLRSKACENPDIFSYMSLWPETVKKPFIFL